MLKGKIPNARGFSYFNNRQSTLWQVVVFIIIIEHASMFSSFNPQPSTIIPQPKLSLIRELLDALLVFELANQEPVIILGHDVSVESDNHHLLLLYGVYHTAAALVKRDVGSYGNIAGKVLVHLYMQ